MWPPRFRKKKPYTADELSGGCEREAESIKRARGSGEIVHMSPPYKSMFLGPVHPPGGGEVTNWKMHCAVSDGDRIYDKMTGPNGMTIGEYATLFDHWDMLIIRTVEDE